MALSTAQLTLPGDPASVPAARHFVTEQLRSWGLDDVAMTAELCVSELVTNAALHAKTAFTVLIEPAVDGTIRIEVRDGSTRTPRLRQQGGDSTTGRGLRILDELSLAWGVDLLEGGGKSVWVLLEDHPVIGSGTGDGSEEEDVEALLLAFADAADVEQPPAPPSVAIHRIAA